MNRFSILENSFQRSKSDDFYVIFVRIWIIDWTFTTDAEALDEQHASKSSQPFFSPTLVQFFFGLHLGSRFRTATYINNTSKIKKSCRELFLESFYNFFQDLLAFASQNMELKKKWKIIWEKFSYDSFFETYGSIFL